MALNEPEETAVRFQQNFLDALRNSSQMRREVFDAKSLDPREQVCLTCAPFLPPGGDRRD